MPSLPAALLTACALFASVTVQAQGERKVSLATNATTYRFDGARHLYNAYPERVHRGRLTPLGHAMVVTEADLDARGNVRSVRVIRSNSDDPEVAQQVSEMIRQASPLPAPVRMGGTTYRDIWRVDDSGRFQLETLSDTRL